MNYEVKNLLEEKDRDLEISAKAGQLLLAQNAELTNVVALLTEQNEANTKKIELLNSIINKE